jgi:hypothetical protein
VSPSRYQMGNEFSLCEADRKSDDNRGSSGRPADLCTELCTGERYPARATRGRLQLDPFQEDDRFDLGVRLEVRTRDFPLPSAASTRCNERDPCAS